MAIEARFRAAILTSVFAFIDIALCVVCLCGHGNGFAWTHFVRQFELGYSFLDSTTDFLLLSLLRVSFLATATGLLCAGATRSSRILTFMSYASSSIAVLCSAFSPTKLLALAEHRTVLPYGDWLALVENIAASLATHLLLLDIVSSAQKAAAISSIEDSDASNIINPAVHENAAAAALDDAHAPPAKATAEVIMRLLQYCKAEWIWHLSGFTWLFIYSITRIFVPYYTGSVIGAVVSAEGDKYAGLYAAVKLMLALSIITATAGGFRGGSFEYAYARINRAVRNNLFASLVQQEVAFFDKHKTGEITSRLSADTQTMSDTVALNVNVFLRNIVQMGGSMLFMLTLCWKLSLVPFIVIPVILVASKIFGTYYDYLSEKTQATIAQSNDVAEEVLSTMRTVRSFACEGEESQRYYGKLTDSLAVVRRKAFAYVGFLWVSELFQAVITIAVLWYGGHLVLKGELKKDLLVAFLLYQAQLADNIAQLSEVWTGLMNSVGASRKVFEYIDRKPALTMHGSYMPEKVVGRIQFENVNFSYPTRPELPILKNLSFDVKPGEVVALVGPSGSGKSSCIALLEHFYEPTNGRGRILIDGVPLTEYDHRYIHNAIALVSQEPVLFARNVSENIAYGLDSCTQVDVVEAAKMANAHSFIVDTHRQYNTNVGEKGSQMSGGQKQRIAIARALVRQPSILLLDEATSALDTESEALVQEAIYKNLKGRSVILIAHRLSTVEKADKIVVISKGVVEQQGTHEELLSQEGIYKTLVQRQMISVGEPADPSALPRARRKPPPMPPRGPPTRSINLSPRSMAQSLLATSFTQSTSSYQSK